MKNLNELKKSILQDGVIDASEVKKIKVEIYADGKIDRNEANFLFALNDATSGKKNHSSWKKLFVEAISNHLLNDEKSPGAIDADEAKWLISKVQSDGKIDKIEKALLKEIKKRANSVPKNLQKIFSKA